MGIKGGVEPTISDMLCSTGYLPPRNERDLQRFDLLYYGSSFDIEAYSIEADVIFDKVIRSATNNNNNGN